MNIKYVSIFIFLFVILWIFKTWIFSSVISAGDFEYYSAQRIKDIMPLGIWDATRTGLGASLLPSLWLESYTTTTIKLASFISWPVYIRIFWYFPYILFSFLSSFLLFKTIFKNNPLSFLSGFLYTTNTYTLLMVAGGQMGIALSYALTPFVYLFFLRLLNKLTLENSIIFGLSFSLVSLIDIRIGYMVAFSLLIFLLFNLSKKNNTKTMFLLAGLLPLFITIGIHAFWLLPALFSGKQALQQLGDVYTSVSAIKYFSFATFENSLGLLHPNWPENVFGKIGFMKPEFLTLPIIAYTSLFFINKEDKSIRKIILFLASIGLLGAFLAKGTNEPFGAFYEFLFNYFPGFVMFRDPTKWYSLVALSYSILIPYTLYKIYLNLKAKF